MLGRLSRSAMGIKVTSASWLPVDFFPLGLLVILGSTVRAQPADPCADNKYAIYLPPNGQCLVPINNAKDWVQAQKTCEQGRGDLYRLRNDLRLTSSPRVASCLAAMPANELGNDFWIGAISTWSMHWFWVNETLLNPIRYETRDRGAFDTSMSVFEVCSAYLSVDYCVSVCHDDAAAFTVIHRQRTHPCCFCSFRLDMSKVNKSSSSYLRFADQQTYYVAAAREGTSNIISLTSSETLTETETLCAVVDTETAQSRELLSKTCFSKFPFLCSLGNDTSLKCDSVNCQGTQCRFRVRNECVQRDRRPMTWFRARTECLAVGGDLWTVSKLDDMYQVARYLVSNTFYWVGATDHAWVFDAGSNVFGSETPDYEVVRCGHMFLESSGVTAQALQWEWADTQCDQQKSYICQYEQTTYTSANTDEEVRCPWLIPEYPSTPNEPDTSPSDPNTPSTSSSSVTPKEGGSLVSSDSTYPIIPIIAACIAALVILLCAILMLGYSRRRRWLMKRWKRTRDYVWPFWASSPTYLAPGDHTSDQGFDSLSTAHTDSGSAFPASGQAFVFPDHAYTDGGPIHATTKGHGHAHRAGSKDESRKAASLDNHKLGGGAKERLPSRASLNSGRGGRGGASSSESGYGAGLVRSSRAGVGAGGGAHPDPLGADENLLQSASYASLSPRAREYMTLSAHMNIRDDVESANQSVRSRKPEVALVTNDVDLNFTVNHAYARSRFGSEVSSEKGLDEIDLPMSPTVQVPTRTVEESVMGF